MGLGGTREDSGIQNCRVGSVQAWGAEGPVRTLGDSFVQAGAVGRLGGCGPGRHGPGFLYCSMWLCSAGSVALVFWVLFYFVLLCLFWSGEGAKGNAQKAVFGKIN